PFATTRAMTARRGPQRKPMAPLTPRQSRVVDLVARGRRTREIAKALGISERAVSAHITRLFSRYRVSNRAGLIAAVMAERSVDGGEDPDALRHYANAPFLVAMTRGREH